MVISDHILSVAFGLMVDHFKNFSIELILSRWFLLSSR